MSEPVLRIQLLGPFAATLNDRPATVPAGRQRALLATLALAAGREVSVDALAERLWDSALPLDPRSAIQNVVRRLRRLLGAETIRTGAGGYSLNVPPENVDAVHFPALVRQAATADPATARLVLSEAMTLWRGEPLAGVVSEVLGREHGCSLREVRLTAIERRIDLDLADGRSTDIVPELRELLAEYPLREPLWERLIRALDQAGRPAEALAAFEQVRRLLAESIGADPSPRLQELHQELLNGPPPPQRVERAVGDAVPTSMVPRQLPPAVPWFTGRADDLQELDRLVAEPNGSPVIVLHGPGGTGKTTLGVEWARRLARRPAGELFVDLRGFSSEEPLDPGTALGMVLRALGVPAHAVPMETAERSAMLRTRLAERPALLVLDNARDADQVRPLLPGGESLVLVTSRNELRGLAVRDGAQQHRLLGMSDIDATCLVTRVLTADGGQPESSAVAELVKVCAHLPLAMVIAVQQALRSPDSSLVETVKSLRQADRRLDLLADPDDLSSDVRAVISWSYQALTEQVRRAFRLLSLHPWPEIEVGVAAALLDEPAADARRLLDRLSAVHLLETVRRDVYRFHDLVADFAAELGAQEAAVDEVRARILDWYLRTLFGARAAAFALTSFDLGEPLSEHVRPREFAGFDEAVSWYEQHQETLNQLLRLAVDRAEDRQAVQLAAALAHFQNGRNAPEQVTTAELALVAAKRLGTPSELATAYYLMGNGLLLRRLDFWGSIEWQQKAQPLAEAAGEDRLLAASFTAMSKGYGRLGMMEEARQADLRSVEVARRLGLPERLGASLLGLGAGEAHMNGLVDDAIAHTLEAIEAYRSIGESYMTGLALGNLTYMYLSKADPVTALAYADQALRLVEDPGDLLVRPNALIGRGMVRAATGDPEGARADWEEALRINGMARGDRIAEIRALLDGLDRPDD